MVNFAFNSITILGMVNFGFNSASLLGIFLILSGAGLYLLRSLRPEVSRDHDIFFAAVGLLCGFILIFQGWRLDPILQFSQLLLAGSTIFFAIESIRLRGVTTQQARGRGSSAGGSGYVDNDRPVSRVYRAELEDDQWEEEYDYQDEYEEEVVPRRRLQGTATRSSSRRGGYEEGYGDEAPRSSNRRSRSRRSSGGYQEDYDDRDQGYSSRRPSRRPSSGGNRRPSNVQDVSWEETEDSWSDDSRDTRSSRDYDNRDSRDSRDYDNRRPTSSSRGDRRRPNSGGGGRRRPRSADDIVSNMGTEYVDYQPLDDEQGDINNDSDNGNDRDNNQPDNDSYEY